MVGRSSVKLDSFAVSLAGHVVGHLHHRGDYCWLEWQEGYWEDPTRPVLGLRFENEPSAKVASALRLPPWFSNLLPEGRLRDWVARDADVHPSREMLLLRRLGLDLPGAIVVTPAEEPVDPGWRPDEKLALPAPKFDDKPGNLSPRFSLAGVALKFSMLQTGDRLTLPANQNGGNWIVKLPDSLYEKLPQNEFAAMRMASLVGIQVPEIRLLHRDDLPELPDSAWPMGQEWAFAIQRFDRVGDTKVHMEDLAQVKGVYPDAKYDGSFATAAALVYRNHDTDSLLEFMRRLFFSYAIGNGDMHLKNTTLIYPDGRRPKISPAYDIICTTPYLMPAEVDLGLKLVRGRRFEDVSDEAFGQLASKIGAPRSEVDRAIASMASGLIGALEACSTDWEQLPIHHRWLRQRLPQIVHRFS